MFKKTIIVLSGCILLAYLSIPWIAKPIIEYRIPDNVELIDLDLGYPTFSGVWVNRSIIRFNGMTIEVEGFTTDYDFKTLNLDSLVIKLPESEITSDVPFSIPQLPIFAPKETLKELKNKNFNAKNVLIKTSGNELFLEKINASSDSQSKLNISISKLEVSKAVDLSNLSLSITPYDKAIAFKIESDDYSTSGKYIFDNETIKTDIIIETANLEKFIPEEVSSFVDISLPFEFSIEQNLKKDADWKPQEFSKILILAKVKPKQWELESKNAMLRLSTAKDSKSAPPSFKFELSYDTSSESTLENGQPEKSIALTMGSDIKPDSSNRLEFTDLYTHTIINGATYELDKHSLELKNVALSTNIESVLFEELVQKKFEISYSSESSELLIHNLADEKSKTPVATIRTTFTGTMQDLSSLTFQSESTVKGLNVDYISTSDELSLELAVSDFDLANHSGNFELSIFDAEGTIKEINYESIFIDLKGKLSEQRVTLEGSTILNGEFSIPLSANLNLGTTNGKIFFPKKSNEVSSSNSLIKQLTNELFDEVAFSSGKVIHEGFVNIGKQVDGELELALKNADISFDENTANSINISSKLKLNNLKHSAEAKVGVTSLELSSGLEISNISLDLESNDDLKIINEATAKILSGSLNSKAKLNKQGLTEPTVISLKNVSIFDLISFLNVESLYADGFLDISIPIESVNGGYIVKEGTFKSTKTGVIKYDIGQSGSDTGNMALEAIKNLNYQELDGTIDYDDKVGDYKIKLHFLGANPDFQKGRPVEFTLTFNGNMPGIFKKLFITGNFEEAILKSLKDGSLNDQGDYQ